MRVFFLADRPCLLTLGGIHLGVIDGFERSVELNPADGVVCELKPLGGFLPAAFCLDESFLCSPPPPITLYYTEDALALYAEGFLRADQSLKVLSQTRLDGSLLTFTLQGKVQLRLENQTGFHLIDLPDAFETCTAERTREGFLLRGKDAFALLSEGGDILLLSEGTVLSSDGPLRAEVPFHDSLLHTALCEWDNGKLVSCSIRARFEPTETTFALALFESALIGADLTPYLADDLLPKAHSLKRYLGDYRSVVLTDEIGKVGLVYPRRERVFDVRYFRVETREGKITNIKPL